ncbi:Hypothetical protein CINCED_3A020186 [Cinara cedri]|uniref:Uncharacterized protein n=1 Tax=Cinara cedri TaxID=506608 RepID=A0A5E4MTX1_9HEMI|nr:Hypothetical protein CINCED_3A020186 [Cinara cedri]
MRKSVYTKTALASLLTLYSFSGFTAGEEVKKQGHKNTSQEVMKTSNKKLKEKMDRICNADPEKKAKEAKKKAEEEAMRKAEGDKKKADEAKKKADDAKKKAEEEAMKKAEQAKKKENLKSASTKQKVVARTVEADGMKSVANRNIENKAKIADCDDSYSCCTQKRGVKITFGGTVDAQGYGKVSAGDSDKFKHYNVMLFTMSELGGIQAAGSGAAKTLQSDAAAVNKPKNDQPDLNRKTRQINQNGLDNVNVGNDNSEKRPSSDGSNANKPDTSTPQASGGQQSPIVTKPVQSDQPQQPTQGGTTFYRSNLFLGYKSITKVLDDAAGGKKIHYSKGDNEEGYNLEMTLYQYDTRGV